MTARQRPLSFRSVDAVLFSLVSASLKHEGTLVLSCRPIRHMSLLGRSRRNAVGPKGFDYAARAGAPLHLGNVQLDSSPTRP